MRHVGFTVEKPNQGYLIAALGKYQGSIFPYPHKDGQSSEFK